LSRSESLSLSLADKKKYTVFTTFRQGFFYFFIVFLNFCLVILNFSRAEPTKHHIFVSTKFENFYVIDIF
jgi:hypothetical protein